MADETREDDIVSCHEKGDGSSDGGAAVAVDETDEGRKVTALSNELRISSAIRPQELLLLQRTTPLESDEDITQEGGVAAGEGALRNGLGRYIGVHGDAVLSGR